MTATPDTAFSACPHDCPSTCALDVEVLEGGRIGRIRGAKDNSYTDGVVCAKVARYAERIHHPDRLQKPLQRFGAKGSGEFRPIAWDDALDEIAGAFEAAEKRHGSEAVWPYYYAGTMGLVMRDGINRLRHAKRYSGQHLTICSAVGKIGFAAGTGKLMGPDPREMALSDLIVIWGTNAVATQVNVMTHVAKAQKARNAKLVVVDTYRTPTAEKADLFVRLNPGTDGALAAAIMHVLFRDGLADLGYMEKYADAPQEFEAHLQGKTPAWAAAVTGVDADTITTLARMIGATKRTYLRLGYGFTRTRNGALNMHAASSIATVAGLWPHEGGGAFHGNGAIFATDKTMIEGLDMVDPTVRVLDMSRIGDVLTGDAGALMGGPPVTAMLIQNTNPMAVAPDLTKVHAGFARDDLFVAVHEHFMTETAAVSDIVLPATMFLEHDDIYQAGGQQSLLAGPKAIAAPGECRSNHDVVQALAQRLGAEHPGFAMSAAELADHALKASNRPGFEELAARRWVDCQPDFATSHYIGGFAHADKKFHFRIDWASLEPGAFGPEGGARAMPAFPDFWPTAEAASDEHPFRMVTPPARNFLNSTFTETPTSRAKEGGPHVKVHPDDAARLSIADGDKARLGNRRGSVTLKAKIFDGLNPGVIVVEGVWPNADFEDGIGINALTGADPTAPIGGAPFHDNAVWLQKA